MPPIGRTALWVVAFVISSVAVRDASMMANGVPVVGPAIGVALLWLASSDNWWRDGPVLLAATRAFEAGFDGRPGEGWRWVGLLAAFALVYIVAGVFGFGALLEES